jgi:hypothetical protein
MLEIYQAVYDKIRRLTQSETIAAPLTQPFSSEVTSLLQASAAYKKAYEAIDEALTPSMLAAINPEFEPQLKEAGYTLDKNFTEEQKRIISQRRRFIAMQNEKNIEIQTELRRLNRGYGSNISQLQQEISEKESAETAIASAHYHIHNCISISTWVMFELLARGIPATQIERFHKPITANGTDDDAHAFVVVNRKPGSAKSDMTTWGDDCYIIDPWYGFFGKAINLAKDPERFQKYYLIVKLNDKKPVPCAYSPNMLSSYIDRMNAHIPQNEDKIPRVHIAQKTVIKH